jgi:hypothetical protein
MAPDWDHRRVGSAVAGLMASALVALGSTAAEAKPCSEWTVVTLALDGSWGTGTADRLGCAPNP